MPTNDFSEVLTNDIHFHAHLYEASRFQSKTIGRCLKVKARPKKATSFFAQSRFAER